MFKKLFVILSLAVISCFAFDFDEKENAAAAGAVAARAELGRENFATAEDFANQCRTERDYATYNEWHENYGPNWEEQTLQYQIDNPYYYGYRPTPAVQAINRVRLTQLQQARRDRGRDWMMRKIPERQSRLRREQSEREHREAQVELERILGNGQVQKSDWQVRDEQRQERDRLLSNLENNNIKSGFTSRESLRSLHPYLSYSIFGLVSLFFMYKFAHKNSEEIKN